MHPPMIARKTISAVALSVGLALPCAAAKGVTPIGIEQIADAIAAAGVNVSADQITLLSDMVAKSKYPVLKVGSMERWGDRRIKVRLECAVQGECMPFFVAVHWKQSQPGFPNLQLPATTAGQAVRPTADATPFAVRAGSSATLLLDGDHIHIQLPVVCLENGRSGQTIRVSSKDRRQIYMAEVVDNKELRSRLQ